MQMQGKKQLERDVLIDAPVEFVYELFMDNSQLASWAPPVNEVVHEVPGDHRGVGTTRTCAVTMQGRAGTMVERCVEAVAETRASFVVVDDSFGFQRMFKHYAFTVHFSREGAGTRVRMETFYTPAHVVASLMNAAFLRRKFGTVVRGLVQGLHDAASQRYRATA